MGNEKKCTIYQRLSTFLWLNLHNDWYESTDCLAQVLHPAWTVETNIHELYVSDIGYLKQYYSETAQLEQGKYRILSISAFCLFPKSPSEKTRPSTELTNGIDKLFESIVLLVGCNSTAKTSSNKYGRPSGNIKAIKLFIKNLPTSGNEGLCHFRLASRTVPVEVTRQHDIHIIIIIIMLIDSRINNADQSKTKQCACISIIPSIIRSQCMGIIPSIIWAQQPSSGRSGC